MLITRKFSSTWVLWSRKYESGIFLLRAKNRPPNISPISLKFSCILLFRHAWGGVREEGAGRRDERGETGEGKDRRIDGHLGVT